MKEQLKKIITDYGKTIEIAKKVVTLNSYGEETYSVGSKKQVKGVITDGSNKFILRYFGLEKDVGYSVLVPYDVNVTVDDIIIINGKQHKINTVSPLYFKEDIVVYVLDLVN